MTEAAETCERLAHRLQGMRDLPLRVRYVRSVLERLEPTVAADLLLLARGGADARSPGHRALHLAALVGLAEDEAADLRDTLADAAVRRGHDEVAMLLRRPDTDDPGDDPKDSANGRPGARVGKVPEVAGRPLTLGERKSLARRADRQTIDRALRDPHPEVIAILLGNPFLTESDVVRLSARRDVMPGVLRAIFRSLRWVVRHSVRRALVKNPRTPLSVGLALAPHLDDGEAKDVARSAELADELRQACARRGGRLATTH